MALDPGAQQVVDMIVAANRPSYDTLTAAQAREVYLASRKVLQPLTAPEVAEVTELSCPGPGGDIRLRLYLGKGAPTDGTAPCLVYFHGGGWVIGNLDSHDVLCRDLANEGRCTVVSVDYRLAPEHKFPAAADDSIAATRWVAANAGRLGIDVERIAVGGDSAGGNLAAVVALHARDKGGPALCYQLLIYPATDMNAAHPSYDRHAQQLPLTKATMLWFIEHYMHSPADKNDWRASPLKAKSCVGVAPAYVLTAGYDPLSDEGAAYAAKLEADGVSVARRRWEGQIHGFMSMGAIVSQTADAAREIGTALRTAFTP